MSKWIIASLLAVLLTGQAKALSVWDLWGSLPLLRERITQNPVLVGDVFVEIVAPADDLNPGGKVIHTFNASREEVVVPLGCGQLTTIPYASNGHAMKDGVVLLGGSTKIIGTFRPDVQKFWTPPESFLAYAVAAAPSLVMPQQYPVTQNEGTRTDRAWIMGAFNTVGLKDSKVSSALAARIMLPIDPRWSIYAWSPTNKATWPPTDEEATTKRLRRLHAEAIVSGVAGGSTEAEDAQVGRLTAQVAVPNSIVVKVSQWADKADGTPAFLAGRDVMLHLFLTPQQGLNGIVPPNVPLPSDCQVERLQPREGYVMSLDDPQRLTAGRFHIALRWTGDSRKAVFMIPKSVLPFLPHRAARMGTDGQVAPGLADCLVYITTSQDGLGMWRIEGSTDSNELWISDQAPGMLYRVDFVSTAGVRAAK